MRFVDTMSAAAVLFLASVAARAERPNTLPTVGEEYEITNSYETAEQGSDGSSSSSRGSDTILERVIGVRQDGVELEYDLPKNSTAEDRARNWQFPARVFRAPSGSMVLLNRADLESRLDAWLKAAGWSREVCGRWIFTWNAFRIECDPQSVIKTLDAFDLRSIDVRGGATYRDTAARQAGTLARIGGGSGGESYSARMEIDPDAVRRSRAEADVAVGEIMRKPVALDSAFRERAKESISGAITVTFATDAAGNAWRRTKVTKLETKNPDGVLETSTATEIVTRRLVSPAKP